MPPVVAMKTVLDNNQIVLTFNEEVQITIVEALTLALQFDGALDPFDAIIARQLLSILQES